MKIKTSIAAAAFGLVALGLAAPQAVVAQQQPAAEKPKPKRQCFWASQVNNFAAQSDRVVNIRVGVNDVYSLEIFGVCPEIDWTQSIGLVSTMGDSICQGLDAELIVPSAIGPQRCAVRNIRKLTPAEVAALPPRARP